MVHKIKHKEYYTNITSQELIDKCIHFFSEGCTSYAISFENAPKYVICEEKVKNISCKILKGFNDKLMFVPIHAKDSKTIDDLYKSGLDSIEI